MDLKQGDLENIILNALWDLEVEGVSQIYVGDVQDRIRSQEKRWAYTTVKTVLDRLVEKDIAKREKMGKKYFYSSLVKRQDAGSVALEKVLRQFFKNDVDALLNCLTGLRQNIMPSLALTR
jgi:predicted transcriptional regulator